ncbi:MAG: pyridoxamine 5'-phosphate oxidase [Candidatus Margulisbacteria bacterium]|nr:pyridoxamine 5'-phosphate oxidase [Candidatus Margulisiibacteriota bacterium]
MENPIQKFDEWWELAKTNSPLKHKNAVCVSTITKDGFPNGRFVDLKSVDDQGFVFCSNQDSQKGKDLARNSKVSMTIWWDHVGFQIRIVGLATLLPESESELLWAIRSRDAQLATLGAEQSQVLNSEQELLDRVERVGNEFEERIIPRPKNWGGYKVKPLSIEFLLFKENRLHIREFYDLNDKGIWRKRFLQP